MIANSCSIMGSFVKLLQVLNKLYCSRSKPKAELSIDSFYHCSGRNNPCQCPMFGRAYFLTLTAGSKGSRDPSPVKEEKCLREAAIKADHAVK